MAKVAYSKLKLTKKDDVKTIKINDIDVEVKQYLSVNDKINIIMNVLNNSIDENNFCNPIKVEVYANLEIVYAYTNLSFTDKQKEDITKLYDILEQNDVFNLIVAEIPSTEYNGLMSWMQETIDNYYNYRNSAYGIMESISKDYAGVTFDAAEIQEKVGNPETLGLLKDVMNKLG